MKSKALEIVERVYEDYEECFEDEGHSPTTYSEAIYPIIASYPNGEDLCNRRWDYSDASSATKLQQALAFTQGVAVGMNLVEDLIDEERFKSVFEYHEIDYSELTKIMISPAITTLFHILYEDLRGYYVYEALVDGEIKYVGKGKGNRLLHVSSGRSSSKKLNAAVLSGGSVEVRKVAENLLEGEALELERKTIIQYFKSGVDLYNKRPKSV
jgi:hypothetical protein